MFFQHISQAPTLIIIWRIQRLNPTLQICCALQTILEPFVQCGKVYLSERGHWCQVLDEQQCLGMFQENFHRNKMTSCKVSQENVGQSITLLPPACRFTIVHPGAIFPGKWCTYTRRSTQYKRKHESSDQANFFDLLQFWCWCGLF